MSNNANFNTNNQNKINFTHSNAVVLKCGEYKGYNGFVYDIIPAKVLVAFEEFRFFNYSDSEPELNTTFEFDDVEYTVVEFDNINKIVKVKYDKLILLNRKNLSIKNQKVKVKRGDFLNMQGRVKQMFPVNYRVTIEATGKSINSTNICTGLGNYKTECLSDEHLFFNDIVLKNGKYMQVDEVVGDNYHGQLFSGEKGKVSTNDILNFNGFELREQAERVRIETVFEDNVLPLDQECEIEDDKSDLEDDFEEPEQNEFVQEDSDKNNSSEPETMTLFRDTQRSGIMERKMTREEKDIYTTFNKMTNGLMINSVNFYDVCSNTIETVNILKNECKRIDIQDWKKSDEKYILACLVAAELIKSEYIFDQTTFIDNLMNCGVFTKNNINNSIFLRTYNCETFLNSYDLNSQTIKDLYKLKQYNKIVSQMLYNCSKVININLPLTTPKAPIEYIKLSEPHKEKHYVKNFVTQRDVLNGNITQNSKTVMWNKSSKELVCKWKNALFIKMSKEDNLHTRQVYEYIISNFENAAIIIKNQNNTFESKFDEIKFVELKKVFDKFLSNLKDVQSNLDTLKQTKIDTIKIDTDNLNKRRQDIELCNTLKQVKIN